jgi:heptaprenylglyceryl phosphate synthase
MMIPKVLIVGLHPDVANYDKWPGLTPDKLNQSLLTAVDRLATEGFDAEICYVDHGETASAVVTAKLDSENYACVLIGGGVRKDDDEFYLFESLINVIHEKAPTARICFNNSFDDFSDAVNRWVNPSKA